MIKNWVRWWAIRACSLRLRGTLELLVLSLVDMLQSAAMQTASHNALQNVSQNASQNISYSKWHSASLNCSAGFACWIALLVWLGIIKLPAARKCTRRVKQSHVRAALQLMQHWCASTATHVNTRQESEPSALWHAWSVWPSLLLQQETAWWQAAIAQQDLRGKTGAHAHSARLASTKLP